MLQLAMAELAISETQQSNKLLLYEAAIAGDISRIEELVADGVNVNARDDCGRTALFEASRRGHYESVRSLLTAGADVNAQTGSDLPIELQIQQEYPCPVGLTALSEAAQRGHARVVRMLLDAGADVGAQSKALGYAALGGHLEIVRMLLDAGHEIDMKDVLGGTALSKAAMMGHDETVRMLLDAGANIDGQSEALSQAASGGHKEIVRMLLGAGHDIEAKRSLLGHTPLQSAAWSGRNEIVRMLLEAGADINAQGNLGEAQNILPGADPNAPALTALMLAVSAGHDDTVRLLLEEGADVEAKSYYGTALGLAAGKSHPGIMNMLLAAGADVNARDVRGRTALSMTRDPEVISILYGAGADIKKISDSLLRDIGAMIPAFVSVLLGIFALYLNRADQKRQSTNPETIRRLTRESYLLYFYLCNTVVFILAYTGLISFWFPGFFLYSQYLGYAAALLLMLALISIPVSGGILLVDQWRYSWRAFWFGIAGFFGLLFTAVAWFLNHSIELMFS